MKKGLVLEGGGMRGIFTSGILDVLLENNVEFDGIAGVSAGAIFGCNYKSKQIGRGIRYNKKYCRDPRYVSFRSLIKTGNLYNKEFAYRELPEKLDIFDKETFSKNPMEFYVVCTDIDSGKPIYHKCGSGGREDIEWMRASASLPLVSEVVEIDGLRLSDGGTVDSIPIKFFRSVGYDKNVVILTQPKGYIKKPNSLYPLMKVALRKEKAFLDKIKNRHIMYNDTLAYIEKLEAEGKIFVIRPEGSLDISRTERDPNELERVYQLGRKSGTDNLERIIEYLNN